MTVAPSSPVDLAAAGLLPAPLAVPLPDREPAPHVPHLLSPLTVGTMTLRNRVVMPPMGSNFALPDGTVSDTQLDYYEQRARGGTGLIIVENICVAFPAGSNGTTQLRIDHDRYLPRLYELTERIHRYGAKAAVQLNHAGASANPARTGTPALSSSAVPSKPGGLAPTPMTAEQIAEVPGQYAAAALRAKKAGFDAVEVHAGHSYLLCQFLSPLYNRRTDEYGGSPANRARLVREVLDAIRAAVGPRFPVAIRISADELVAGGNTLDDSVELMRFLADAVDLIDVSAALSGNLQYQIDRMDLPDGWRSGMARRFREEFGTPTIVSGNIRDPRVAERIIADGDSDLVALGRGLIADPWWVRKVATGCADRILDCISCNIGCADNRIRLDRPIRCTVNPDIIGHEDYLRRRVDRPTRVVVVGGGVGGLEAACTAAEVGCQVILLEARDVVGGMVGEAVRLPAKRRIAAFLNHLVRRAARSRVEIRTNTPATVDLVRSLQPDVVVNATGSQPVLPPVPGLRERVDVPGTQVFSILGATAGVDELDRLAGRPVVVIGGGAVGLDVVEACVAVGARVTLVERLDRVAGDLDVITALQMHEMLDRHGVEVLTGTTLTEVGDGWVDVTDPEGTPRRLTGDATYICLGMRGDRGSYPGLAAAFAGTGVDVLDIGDSAGGGKIIDATRGGRDVLLTLTERGVLPA
ncbi:FAD-dependent oxidoreductase [Cellulomonas denverensis]|nr:FAD-dependent oxidoreductase [Cellulomonas denverensis]GIG26856.1 2,4-dienoyl-CoA reductase [Cellulomonas denverensis]